MSGQGIAAVQVADVQNQVWYNPQKPLSLGLPAPIKVLLANAQKNPT